jgi:hypothetical protein
MINTTSSPLNRKWMGWQPGARISRICPDNEPTKPSKPGSVGFEGALQEKSQEICDRPDAEPKSPVPAVMAVSGTLDSTGLPWCAWKAETLNRLFQEQGVTGRPGRITATTVRRGQ